MELDHDNPNLIWYSKMFWGPVILKDMSIDGFLQLPYDLFISEKKWLNRAWCQFSYNIAIMN